VARRLRAILSPAAKRELAKFAPAVQHRLRTAIDRLEANPRPVGAERLKGLDDLLRIRVGDYRIIYRVIDDRLVVLVIRIGHRREVYRAMARRRLGR
jgi:mRNA interferase RelE/StbE